MTNLRFTFLFALLSFYSCAQDKSNAKIDPVAKELDRRAMKMFYYFGNADSLKKAVSLLDSATALDSNYYSAYRDKANLLLMSKKYDNALQAINNLVRLKPALYDNYMSRGFIYYRLGDINSSKADFQKSLTICSELLDTMSTDNKNLDYVSLNKGISLIMVGEEDKGNQIIKLICDRQQDGTFKEYYRSYLNKNAKEIIDLIDSQIE